MALDREQVGLLFKIRADSSEAQRTLTQFRGTVNNAVGDMRGKFDGLANSISGFSSSLSGGLGGLAGSLTGVAGLAAGAAAGIFAIAKSAAAAISDLDDLTQKTGLSVEALSALKVQLEQDNVSMESFGKGVQFLQRHVVDAQTGNKELLKTFKDLGIELSGTTEDVLRRVVARFQQLPDEAQKTAFATRLFGRAGADLVVTLNNLNGDLDGHVKKMRELGLTVTPEAAKAAADFEDQLDLLTRQFSALKIEVGNAVIPAFSEYVKKLNETIVSTKSLIRENGTLLGTLKAIGQENAKRILEGVVGAGQSIGLFNPFLPNAPNLNPNKFSPAQLKALLDKGTLTQGLPAGFGGTDKDKKGKESNLPNLPIRDFSNIVEQYFKQLGQLEDEQIKRLDQAQARSARVQEEILQAAQDREIAALQDQIDQRVITEEEGAARIAAVRVAAFARYEDQINRQIAELDEQITTATSAAQAKPFDSILQARLRALQAERELVRNQLTLLQDERTAIEEEGNRAIAAARDRGLQDLLAYAEEQKRIYQDLQQTRLEAERLDPLSARSIFGDAFADTLRRTGSEMLAFKATFADFAASIRQESADLGSLADTALNSFTQGLAAMVEQFVLTGTTGPAALRQLTASVLLNVAKMAAVKAIFALAEGFIQLALFNFPAAAAAFKAAALYGAVAVAAGAAGGAIAPSSSAGGNFTQGGQSQNNGRRVIEQGDRQRPEPQIIIIRAETEPGVVVRKVVEDYRGNGESRKLLRRDMLGEGG